MRLLLVRHGETEWNKDNRVLGRTDIELNRIGVSQTEALVRKLSPINIDAVFSSPLKRASDVGNAIANEHKIKCTIEKRLIEMNFGVFEGVQRDDGAYQKQKRMYFMKYPDGESYLQVAGRVYPLLGELKNKYKDKTVLLVTHNGICRIISSFFEDMTLEEFACFSMKNCEVREYFLE